jgi:REP element-mobilizing transposase RayT
MPRDHDQYRTHHRSRRLPDHDYASPAAYFVTICAHERICLFGEIEDGQMHLNAWGQVAAEEWHRTETLRDEVHLDAFVIMPNHIHGIVVIAPPNADAPTDPRGYESTVATQRAASLRGDGNRNVTPKSLGAIVRSYKSAVTRRINRMRDTPGAPVWQRNYHDRVIRDETEWRRIRRYIDTNPARWPHDSNHPTRL